MANNSNLMKAYLKTDWKFTLFITLFAVPKLLFGQPLEVSNGPPITPENLITNIFLGEGVEVVDVQFQGTPASVGFFQNGGDEVGLQRGIVMSTGFAATNFAQVGVDSPGGAQSSTWASGAAFDPDMEALAGTDEMNDLVAYTITFIPISDTLRFRYVFASEEYPEYVCSDFNDVFGFFISGPGINGPYSNGAENIALIPGTSLPVAINNVNPGVVGSSGTPVNCIPPNGSLAYSQYYNNNNGSPNRPVYNGLTDVFTAEAVVFPCSTYTIKLVICDVADELFDSGVFLEAKSFGTGSLDVEAVTVSLDGSVAEGCAEGQLIFSLPAPAESDHPIDYLVLGTAENGVDYEFIPPGLFIPAGDSILSIPIIALDDGLPEGTETIVIDVQRDPCNRDTIIIPIRENILLEPELPPDTSLCRGESITLDGSADVPLPEPPVFYSEDTLVISPPNVTLYSDIEVFGVLPATLGPGVIRSVCIEDLRTTWVDDLRIFLISPGGQFLELVTDIGNAGDNFIGTCFTPLATTPITSLGAAAQPFTGEFAPEGTWADLYGDGRPVNGAWRLALLDKFSADVPVLNRWSITFTPSYEINYSWQPAAGLSCVGCPEPMASPDTTATYTVAATDSYGCSASDEVAIEVLPPLAAPQLSCAVVTSNSITVDWPAVSGATGYEVNVDSAGWTLASGNEEHTVTGLNLATSVHLQVRATGPCENLISTIECSTPDCVPPTVQVLSITDASCFGSGDGSITLSATGGVAPYQFIVNGQANTSGIFAGLEAGAYLVQAIDDSGCPAALEVAVGQMDSLATTLSVDSVSCNALADGSAVADVFGGIEPYTFLWSDGQGGPTATGLAAGAYQLTVTDAGSCSSTYEITVGEPPALTVEVETDSALCAGIANGRARVTAAGGSGVYNYDFGPGIIIGTSSNHAVGLSAGDYAVTVTDSEGCEVEAGYTIGEPLPLQAQLSAVDASCAGTSSAAVEAAVSGGAYPYTFTWLDAAMDVVGIGPSQDGLPAGQYILEVEDVNGCSTSANITAGQPLPLDYSLEVVPATCPGVGDGSASLQISGGVPGYAYNWNDIGPGPAARDNLATGDYTVTVTDLNGCTLEIALEVTSPQAIALDVATTPASCFGNADGQAMVVASGGAGNYSYLWGDGQNTPVATGLSAGSISVLVTDENGCQANETAVVDEPSALAVVLEGAGPGCFGGDDGTATATGEGGAGGYSYQWNGGQDSPTVAGLSAGLHRVTVTDGNGCTAIDSILLEEPAALMSSATTEAATCNPQPDGSAMAAVQGGTPPYAFSWSDGQSQPTAEGLAIGSYTLSITDANGCLRVDTVEVGGIPPIMLVLEKSDASCNGGADGAATVTAQGGTGNYTYNWSAGVPGGPQATNLAAGNYSVTVMDELGCFAIDSILVGEPEALLLETIAGQVSCSGDMDGRLSLAISGGAPPYQVLWSTGDNTNTPDGLGVGSYFVTVTDANGCQASGSEQVFSANPIDITVEMEDALCFGQANGAARVQASGGEPPYAFRWSNGATGPALENIAAGNYSLSITDAAGCEVVEEVAVGQPDEPLWAALNPANVSCYGKTDGRIEVETFGGTPTYRYSLDGEFFSGSNVFIGLDPGTYTVQIRDANGCTLQSRPVVVGEPQPILVDLGETKAVGFGQNFRLLPIINGGAGGLSFSWTPRDSTILDCFDCRAPLVTVTEQASLKLVVTDEGGCIGEDIVTVYPQKDRPVFVPTGFTPNEDGNNDRLLVHAREDIQARIRYFRVYDRWGELLFEANEITPNDEQAGWDGTFRGKPVQAGLYIWHLGVEFVDGNREEFSGSTTLIR